MKRFKTVLLYILLCLSTSRVGLAETITGRVIGVSDGDSLTVLDASLVQYKIRLAGIDAPEKRQAFGQRAKQSLAALCFGKLATVEIVQQDRYGRFVGHIYVEDVHINLAQVESGYAWVYMHYLHQLDFDNQIQFQIAEANARAAALGLWQDPHPLPPWIFRRQSRK